MRRDAFGKRIDKLNKIQHQLCSDVKLIGKKLGTPNRAPESLILLVCSYRTDGNPKRVLKFICDLGYLRYNKDTNEYQVIKNLPYKPNLRGTEAGLLPLNGITNICEYYENGVRTFTDEHIRTGIKDGDEDSAKTAETMTSAEIKAVLTKEIGKRVKFRWCDILTNHAHVEARIEGALTSEASKRVFRVAFPKSNNPTATRTKMKKLGFIERTNSGGRRTFFFWAVNDKVKKCLTKLNIDLTLSDAQIDHIIAKDGISE